MSSSSKLKPIRLFFFVVVFFFSFQLTILSHLFRKRIQQKEAFFLRSKHISITLSLWTSTEKHVGVSRCLAVAKLQIPTTTRVTFPVPLLIYYILKPLFTKNLLNVSGCTSCTSTHLRCSNFGHRIGLVFPL